MFVSPPFRHNDIPVSRLFECLTPAPLPTDASKAMLRPINNYASSDQEPWQAPSVLVSGRELCWRCGGTGGVYRERGFKKAMEEAKKANERLDIMMAAPERSEVRSAEARGARVEVWSSLRSGVETKAREEHGQEAPCGRGLEGGGVGSCCVFLPFSLVFTVMEQCPPCSLD